MYDVTQLYVIAWQEDDFRVIHFCPWKDTELIKTYTLDAAIDVAPMHSRRVGGWHSGEQLRDMLRRTNRECPLIVSLLDARDYSLFPLRQFHVEGFDYPWPLSTDTDG